MMGGLKVLHPNELSGQICVVVGTRPSLVKQSAIIRALQRKSVPFFIVHAGQHYSYELDGIFFHDLQIPLPRHHISGTRHCRYHGEQTAEMLRGIERVLLQEKPRAVLVGGDANCNLAGALAARKLQLRVCHEEAGLRGGDWLVPEEHNRVMIDHISDFLFAPNENAVAVLQNERVRGQIFLTGSPIVDSVVENLELARARSNALHRYGLEPDRYILLTIHHEETVDYPDVLRSLLHGIKRAIEPTGLPLVFPIHPRTADRIKTFGLGDVLDSIRRLVVIPPQGYFDFLALLSNARLVMTESGGVIQEASILGVPCVTLSSYTEWIETIDAGANIVAGHEPDRIVACVARMLSSPRNWHCPFGGPGPAARIVDIIQQQVLED